MNIVVVITVLLAKSDSDVMLCLQIYQGLRIDRIDRLLVYYTQMIYRLAVAPVKSEREYFT